MKREDAEEFTQSLGQIVAGSWRQIALAKRLGVPKALGMDVDAWVHQRLGGYVRLSIAERREAVKELAADGESTRAIGEVLGVDHSTIVRDLSGANAPHVSTEQSQPAGSKDVGGADAPPEPIDAVAALMADDKIRSISKATETRQANEEKRKAELYQPTGVIHPGIRHGDFYTLSREIEDNSVELIFTDPPYSADSVELYEKAAEVAARILKDGGSFIAYSGQSRLPDVLAACRTSKRLRYWWTIAGIHSGGDNMMKKLGVRCGWKPLIWFVKGTRGDVQNVLSDVVTGSREKDFHEWQQAESEALYYIEQLTSPGGLVVDLFLGGGTTAVCAEKLNRRWIGFEINAATVAKTTERLNREKAA